MSVMHSYWSVTYVGPHHGVFIKKLERLVGFKVLELEQERFLLNEEKIEHSSFLVAHHATAWPDLVMELLHTAQLIFPVWKITIDKESLCGTTSKNLDGPNVEYQMRISGHRTMRWEINAEQKYSRMRWLSGQPNRW